MLSVDFDCPACATTIRVPATAIGRKGRCPRCREVVRVPAPPPEEERELEVPPELLATPPTEAPRVVPLARDRDPTPDFDFACPTCGRSIRVPLTAIGRKGRCPGCATITRVPEPPGPADEAPIELQESTEKKTPGAAPSWKYHYTQPLTPKARAEDVCPLCSAPRSGDALGCASCGAWLPPRRSRQQRERTRSGGAWALGPLSWIGWLVVAFSGLGLLATTWKLLSGARGAAGGAALLMLQLVMGALTVRLGLGLVKRQRTAVIGVGVLAVLGGGLLAASGASLRRTGDLALLVLFGLCYVVPVVLGAIAWRDLD